MKCYKKDYPRPQFVRKDWTDLNGEWNFRFDDEDLGEKERWYEGLEDTRKIRVPFTYETGMSGIGEEEPHNYLWYERNIEIDGEKLKNNKCILHFEGSDFCTKLWVNGAYAGSHCGGYARFSFDITHLVNDGTNHIVVKVEDSFDMQQPRGKQRWVPQNFGCWYVQTTGIWKTVWSEYVPEASLASVKMTPVLETYALEIEYHVDAARRDMEAGLEVEAEISFGGKLINSTRCKVTDTQMTVRLDVFSQNTQDMEWGVRTWSPETPDLYDIEFRLFRQGQVVDEAGSYFAMREIRIEGSDILLNGSPLYQRLILDQGYWKDSHLTPPDEEALIEDIDKIRALGYNGLRKHQKTEDERFLYWCDVKGMLVWSEMPSTYMFSDDAVEEFTKEWMEIVRQNYNHPCIITWTPFNESWGVSKIDTKRPEQHFTEAIYHLTKSMDPYRPVIVNDGWEHTVSDILTLHDYEEAGEILKQRYIDGKEEILMSRLSHNHSKTAFAKGYSYRGQPVIISEFGGIAFENGSAGWGYGNKVGTSDEFIKRFDMITTAVKELPYVCGYCYTQVTDVQQEINGLMDISRNFKIEPEVIREINERKVGCGRAGV